MNFPCTGCGLCCKHIGPIIRMAQKAVEDNAANDLLQMIAEFPYRFDAAGRCEKLLGNNQCSVYQNRPLVCSVEKVWLKFHAQTIDQRDYFKLAAQQCNSIMIEAGEDDSYLIDIDKYL